MQKKRIATLLGLGVGAFGAAYVAKRSARRAPTEPDVVEVPVVTTREMQMESVVTEVVETLDAAVPDGTNIYANYGPETLLAGDVSDAELGLESSADIVVNGSSAKRAIIAVGLDDDMHEYSEALVERLNGLKKRSYARILLVEDGPTEIAEWIADDADGTVAVETMSEFRSAFQK